MKQYHKEPDFSQNSDLKEFTKIFSCKDTEKKQNEVLQIALNLSNPIESLEKKFNYDKNRNEFKLMDVLEDTNENPEEECIKLKNREILIKEIEATLPPEQANLIKIYFRLDTNEELTKEEVAEKFGWTRFSKTHKRTIVDASRVKNSIDASKSLMKQNPFLKNLLLESLS
jgi:DNA-directed RNA polymerase sigma subunit (sigma70/sigma32)